MKRHSVAVMLSICVLVVIVIFRIEARAPHDGQMRVCVRVV
jgi:hypothetical protein